VLVAVTVVRRGLGPLNAIAAEIDAVTEEDLSTRIGDDSVPVEIVPIKNRLNELLARLEAAFNRERRFTSDVAHELRTPLAGIRSTIEVTLARTRGTDEYERALSECLAIAQRMQTMVNNLLTLARLDTCQASFRNEPIQLKELVDRCWEHFSEKGQKRSITFENSIDKHIIINSDRENVSMVFTNLLDNAAEYTNDTGQIRVTADPIEGAVEVAVTNTGCSLTSDQVAQVFDPFWREDSSRCSEGEHCGLGLALVQRIVKSLGGSCAAQVEGDGIFIIKLTLPRKQ